MKTNLLIATALLLSAASFGQQADTKTTQSETAQAATIQNGSDASVLAYANTRVKSPAAGSVENQVIPAKKNVKKISSSVEKKASGEAKSAIVKGQGATEGNTSAHASLQANSGANAGSGNNKLSQNASLNTGLKTSSSEAKSRVDVVSVEAGSSTAVKAAGGIKQSVKPRPASVKVHSQIKTNASIKIK